MAIQEKIEKSLERLMYASRWLLAPIYMGLSLALFALSVKFFQELFHFLPHILEVGESDLTLIILKGYPYKCGDFYELKFVIKFSSKYNELVNTRGRISLVTQNETMIFSLFLNGLNHRSWLPHLYGYPT